MKVVSRHNEKGGKLQSGSGSGFMDKLKETQRRMEKELGGSDDDTPG
jgi:hypothetical protein